MAERKMPFLNKWAFRLWWLPKMLVLPFTIPSAVVLAVLAGVSAASPPRLRQGRCLPCSTGG